jgi:hypothetical protein
MGSEDEVEQSSRSTIHQDQRNNLGSFAVPPGKEPTRTGEWLQVATPISDEANLVKLAEDLANYLRDAKRRDALGPDELISPLVDAVARNYFQYILRNQARVTPLRRRAGS